ncbi:MAG: BlaI/MecI/CopY family transcriptional regulator [Oscillospiraceae bacterium]|nr:BlaI/MecI/CopY family transcriptional regulator [Oscillospiraceae bacterium]
MEEVKIFDAERKLMELIWERGTVRAAELVPLAREKMGWNKNTTYTVLRRLTERGVLRRSDPGFEVTALVSREEAAESETKNLLSRLYSGSLKLFFSSFLEKERLSREELDQLREIIEKQSGGR